MPSPDLVLRSQPMDKKILDYVLQVTDSSDAWWSEWEQGSNRSKRDLFTEFRLRYQGRRSVASLDRDAKNEPFPRSSNIGIGAEQIFGEFLIPTLMANTHDLDPNLQAVDEQTEKVDEPLTTFHSAYHKSQELGKRAILEASTREILTVGGVFHKWTWASVWKQSEVPVYVFAHPQMGPIQTPNPQTGQMDFMYADPHMPEDKWPTAPDGAKLKIEKIPSSKLELLREGPRLTLRPYEAIEFPPTETRLDPNDWDWMADNFTVSPYWFLGKEGDPFEGKLQNLDKLWKFLNIDPNAIYDRPDRRLNDPVKLKEFHGKFPVTRSGQPAEIIALVATDARILVGWRLSPFPRRPYFNRQVRTRKDSPIGVGIPETLWGFRNALDASVNQDIDAGNLYNHPPMLLSSLAMLEDEEYETTGPGTQWIMQDINGAKFMPPPSVQRNPIERENWLFSMAQRIWGVTDLNMNAPTSSLSPNVSTATGVVSVLNQGSIKFGHLTKRLSETDTQEYQFVHAMFRSMLSNPRSVSVEGQPIVIEPQDRERFFREDVRIVARGDGITTNPMLRQQVLQQYYAMMATNPLIGGDPEVMKDLVEQITSTLGIKLNIKETSEAQFMGLIRQLMQTPNGKQRISQAVGTSMQELQMMAASQNGGQAGAVPQAG